MEGCPSRDSIPGSTHQTPVESSSPQVMTEWSSDAINVSWGEEKNQPQVESYWYQCSHKNQLKELSSKNLFEGILEPLNN